MQKTYKEIILGAAVVVFGFLFWWTLKSVFYLGSSGFGVWALTFASFILFGIALCLAMLLIKNKTIHLIVFGLMLVSFLAFFNDQILYYIIAFIVLFIAYLMALKNIKDNHTEHIKINFWRIWRDGFPLFVTALSLLIAVTYYFSPALTRLDTDVKIPRPIFNVVTNFVGGLIKTQLPEGVTLDGNTYKMLPKDQIQDFEKKYDIKIGTQDTIQDDLYKVINAQINKTSSGYKKSIGYGLAIALFFSLKLLSLIFVQIVIALSWLIIKILIKFNFIKLEKIQKEVEMVSL